MGIGDPGKVAPIRRKDFGIAGALIVLSQLLSSFQSSQNVSKEIEKVKDDFNESLIEREEFFVRKTDIVAMTSKLDQMNEQLIKVNEQLNSLKSYVKDNFALNKTEKTIGCSAQLFYPIKQGHPYDL